MPNGTYHEVSFDVWQQMAAGWDERRQWLWDASRRVGEWMVDALDPQPGQTILELAAGTGETGFAAARRVGDSGKLISTDFAPKMVEAARAESQRLQLANVEHRVLDAQQMDIDDASVDGVLCRWGYMLMADPNAALRETRRVLSEGGRLALSVWGSPQDNPWASIAGRVLVEHTDAAPRDPGAPGIFAMADPARTQALLEDAGFEVARLEEMQVTWRFEDYDAYWSFLLEVAGAIAVTIAALPDQDQRALREKIAAAVEGYRTNGALELPGTAQNVVAG